MLINCAWFNNLPPTHQPQIIEADNLTGTTITQMRRLMVLTNTNNTVVQVSTVNLALECKANLAKIQQTLENIRQLFPFQNDNFMLEWLDAIKQATLCLPVVMPIRLNRR